MTGSPDPEIMNIDEAATLLGVSVKTFNKVLHSQSIPARKIGREWKFSRSALIEWVGDGRSAEFYREGEARNGTAGAPGAGSSEGRSAERRGEPGRRTSGWRLELD